MNLRWSWDDADPRPVPLGRPRRVGRHASTTRCACSASVPPRAARRPRPTIPASCASSARCTPSCSATSTATAGSRPARATRPLRSVAYFSPEFGIAEALPQYSGGLGVLAGDHLKAASDLGVPLVGVGLFYRHGYFRQASTPTAGSRSATPTSTRYAMALTAVRRRHASRSTWPARRSCAQVWRAEVGRVPLYLLDTDIEDNPADLRADHRPALRRRHRAPAAPGDPPRHRRRARPRRARHRRPGVPHQRGPRRLPRPRAHPPARRRTGLVVPRGHRGGAGRRASSPPTRRCRPASTASPAS